MKKYISMPTLALIGCCLLSQACKRASSMSGGGASSPSRSGITIKSKNEPKSDADALSLVGITMMPLPSVEYRDFTAGMDDHMILVIRFHKSRLPEFWKQSKWEEMDSKALDTADPHWRNLLLSKIKRDADRVKDPILEYLRDSTSGILCYEPSGNRGGLKVFLSTNPESEDIVAYIQWFET